MIGTLITYVVYRGCLYPRHMVRWEFSPPLSLLHVDLVVVSSQSPSILPISTEIIHLTVVIIWHSAPAGRHTSIEKINIEKWSIWFDDQPLQMHFQKSYKANFNFILLVSLGRRLRPSVNQIIRVARACFIFLHIDDLESAGLADHLQFSVPDFLIKIVSWVCLKHIVFIDEVHFLIRWIGFGLKIFSDTETLELFNMVTYTGVDVLQLLKAACQARTKAIKNVRIIVQYRFSQRMRLLLSKGSRSGLPYRMNAERYGGHTLRSMIYTSYFIAKIQYCLSADCTRWAIFDSTRIGICCLLRTVV